MSSYSYPDCAYNGCMGCSTCNPRVSSLQDIVLKEAHDTIRRLEQKLKDKDDEILNLKERIDMLIHRFNS